MNKESYQNSETKTNNLETKNQSPTYKYLSRQLSKENRLKRAQVLKDTLPDGAYGFIEDKMTRIAENDQLIRDRSPKKARLIEEKNLMNWQLALPPYKNYLPKYKQIKSYESDYALVLNGDEAKAVVGMIVAQLNKNYPTNISNLFIDPEEFQSNIASKALIELNPKVSFIVPRGSIIGTDSLVNWHGRSITSLKNGKDSNEVIQEYAQRDSKDAPGVEQSNIFVYADGSILVQPGNNHRVAAAILRGDEHIKIESEIILNIMKAEEEVPDPNHWRQSDTARGK